MAAGNKADVFDAAWNADVQSHLTESIDQNIKDGKKTITVVIIGHSWGATSAVNYADTVSQMITAAGGVPKIHLITIDGIDAKEGGGIGALKRAPKTPWVSFLNYHQQYDGIVAQSGYKFRGGDIPGAENHNETLAIGNWLTNHKGESAHSQLDNMLSNQLGNTVNQLVIAAP